MHDNLSVDYFITSHCTSNGILNNYTSLLFYVSTDSKRLRCIENLIDEVSCAVGPSATLAAAQKEEYMWKLEDREEFYRSLIRLKPVNGTPSVQKVGDAQVTANQQIGSKLSLTQRKSKHSMRSFGSILSLLL